VSSSVLDGWQLIALLGALQGVVLAGALTARRVGKTPNRLLAAFVFALALHLASVAYYTPPIVAEWPGFFGVAYPLPLTFGPLVYLYARSASDRTRRLNAHDGWHAIPFLVVVALSIPVYALSGPEKLRLLQQLEAGERPLMFRLIDPIKLVSGAGYAVATLLFLRRHRRIVAENYSSLERVSLQWLQWLALAAGAIWLLASGLDLIERLGVVRSLPSDDLIALAITVLIYAIGYQGLRQPEIFRFDPVAGAAAQPDGKPLAVPAAVPIVEPVADLPAEPVVVRTDAPPHVGSEPAAPRYERSGLSERAAGALKDRLLTLMVDERPYRNAELTLADLAGHLNTTPHKLSEVLNGQLKMNFHDFVNGYRVRDVQQRLRGPDAARLTYLALALDAGFASKSTFNAVFKKFTGETPSQYRANNSD
jgi:AraC-like DNA-binding protein